MPNDGSMIKHEPVAVFTGCICPNVRQGIGIHEPSCPTQPQPAPKKPAIYAGKRAWRKYFEQKANHERGYATLKV